VLTAAGVAGAAQRIFGGDSILSPGKARELRHLDWSVRPEERWDLAPAASFDITTGFAQTVSWWRVAEKLRS
jgi:hypothetical protein